MNKKIRNIGFRGLGLLALALALSGASFAQSAGRNAVTIRGQQQDVYYYPATGTRRTLACFLYRFALTIIANTRCRP